MSDVTEVSAHDARAFAMRVLGARSVQTEAGRLAQMVLSLVKDAERVNWLERNRADVSAVVEQEWEQAGIPELLRFWVNVDFYKIKVLPETIESQTEGFGFGDVVGEAETLRTAIDAAMLKHAESEPEPDDFLIKRLQVSIEMAKAKRRAEGNVTNDKNSALSEIQTIFENDKAEKQEQIEAFEEIVEACQQNITQLKREAYAQSVREDGDND